MARYHRRPRPEPTNEDFMAGLILLGPLAWPIRWAWRQFGWRLLAALGLLLAALIFARCGPAPAANTPEDVGARLRRECESIVRAQGSEPAYGVRDCIAQRGLRLP